MLIINRSQTNPYFNIAAEEYLLKNMEQDCFMLWQNEPSIIVGKHQNTLAEINYSFVKENYIPVIRRISGGGTVYHDLGNLNFTFISSGEKGKLVNFKKFTQPIIEVLNQLGVPARFEGKNDLRVNGFKISGNAEHVYKNKVLHHGTLLFSSDLDYMNQAIKSLPVKYKGKSVQSIRSKVENISAFLKDEISIEKFKKKITEYIKTTGTETITYSLSKEDMKAINQLVQDKYNTWQWNFGYSPGYMLETKLHLHKQIVTIGIFVKNGIIDNIDLQGKTDANIDFLKKLLIGEHHEYDSIESLFLRNNTYLLENGVNPKELVDSMI
jgi:lipoate-protein ligase A